MKSLLHSPPNVRLKNRNDVVEDEDEVEVEVDEEGEVSWRSASVRKRSVGDFTAVVLYPDGMPDEDFVEKYSVSDEGVEWRYPSKPLGKPRSKRGCTGRGPRCGHGTEPR